MFELQHLTANFSSKLQARTGSDLGIDSQLCGTYGIMRYPLSSIVFKLCCRRAFLGGIVLLQSLSNFGCKLRGKKTQLTHRHRGHIRSQLHRFAIGNCIFPCSQPETRPRGTPRILKRFGCRNPPKVWVFTNLGFTSCASPYHGRAFQAVFVWRKDLLL